MLEILVNDDDLIINESELFGSIKHWASRECERQEMQINGTNMRQVLS